jgi:glycosyltransferase involved in cell wall biosynthesis
VVNEAMASGLPVLGSVRSQAVQELVTPGENGYTFDPLGERSQRLEAIDRMCMSKRLGEMGLRSRSVSGRIAPADAAESIVSLLRGLASDSAR